MVGEQATIVRETRDPDELGPSCRDLGFFPDSESLVWSLSVEGVIAILDSSDSSATIRADSAGVVSLRADLEALEGVGSSTRVFVDP